MISVTEARQLVLSKMKLMPATEMPMADAFGYVLAKDVVSPFSLPFFDNSAMDGYAVWQSDCATATEDVPVKLILAGTISAGMAPDKALEPGQAIQILTGAMVPQGADAVIRQEDVSVTDNIVMISRPVKNHENIRFRGEEVKRGDAVLRAGIQLNPAAMAVLASLGIETVHVHQKPRVGILVTGSELVTRQSDLLPGKIFESNSHTLAAALHQMDIPVAFRQQCPDDREALTNAITQGLAASDILLITGGVSVGEFDYVKELVAKAGIDKVFWKVRQKPGKPLYFGATPDGSKVLFGLPGNPASALVGFYEYVRPAIWQAMGSANPLLPAVRVKLKNSFVKKNNLTHFLKGKIGNDRRVEILERQGSHMMSSFAEANCLVVVPEDVTELKEGEKVEVHLLPL